MTFAVASRKADNLLVQFHSVAAGAGGSGITDAAGHYTITGDNGKPGVPPGNYAVTVIDNNLNVEDEPGKGRAVPPSRVSQKYMSIDAKNNPLKVTVQGGKTGYDLKLD